MRFYFVCDISESYLESVKNLIGETICLCLSEHRKETVNSFQNFHFVSLV